MVRAITPRRWSRYSSANCAPVQVRAIVPSACAIVSAGKACSVDRNVASDDNTLRWSGGGIAAKTADVISWP